MNLSVSLGMAVTKLPVTSAAPHCLPPWGAVTANPTSPTPCPLSTSIHRAALSHPSKGSGGALEVPRSLSNIPEILDLSQSTYLVTPWHCCEHLTTLSHTVMDLLSTSSSPRAAKIPGQILLCHKPHPAWDHPAASRTQDSAFLTSVLVLPRPALSEESIRCGWHKARTAGRRQGTSCAWRQREWSSFPAEGNLWEGLSSPSTPLAPGLSSSMEQPHPLFPVTEKLRVLVGLASRRPQVG